MSELNREMIGRRVAEARREAGLTQDELSDLVGRSMRQIQSWEASGPPIRHVTEIAAITGKSKEWLLHGDQVPQDDPYQARIDDLKAALDDAQLDELREMLREVRDGVRVLVGRLDKLEVGASGAAERGVGRASASRRGQSAEKVSEPVAPAREAAG